MRTWQLVDKSGWSHGPWQDEVADKALWASESGLPCLVIRDTMFGHWSGYVGVPPAHPWYGLYHNEHVCQEPYPGSGCIIETWEYDCGHTPEYLADPGVASISEACESREWDREFFAFGQRHWWFGFHCMDRQGTASPREPFDSEFHKYCTLVEAQKACERLADQLARVSRENPQAKLIGTNC